MHEELCFLKETAFLCDKRQLTITRVMINWEMAPSLGALLHLILKRKLMERETVSAFFRSQNEQNEMKDFFIHLFYFE